MRRRLFLDLLIVVAIGMLVVALPLAITIDDDHEQHESDQIHRRGERLVYATEPFWQGPQVRPAPPSLVAAVLPPETHVALTLPNGDRLEWGSIPRGRLRRVSFAGPDATTIVTTVPAPPGWKRAARFGGVLALSALVLVTAAAVVSWIHHRRVLRPLSALAGRAARVGMGDFSVIVPRSGLPEIDQIAYAIEETNQRVRDMLAAEREFSAHASHQLRSPLASLSLRIEEMAGSSDAAVVREAEAALDQVARLNTTIDDLLRLARTGRVGVATIFDAGQLVDEHLADWKVQATRLRRSLTRDGVDSIMALASPGGIGQVVDLLLANALEHGRGRVRLGVRGEGATVAITVADEGGWTLPPSLDDALELVGKKVGVDGGPSRGIGLGLARSLVRTEGGSLDLIETSPTTFRLRIPSGETSTVAIDDPAVTVGVPATAATGR